MGEGVGLAVGVAVQTHAKARQGLLPQTTARWDVPQAITAHILPVGVSVGLCGEQRTASTHNQRMTVSQRLLPLSWPCTTGGLTKVGVAVGLWSTYTHVQATQDVSGRPAHHPLPQALPP